MSADRDIIERATARVRGTTVIDPANPDHFPPVAHPYRFDEFFDRLIGHEGGYSNRASDPGGETNWGVSKRQYPSLDIKALTRDEAKAIYRRDYWNRMQAEAYDPAVAFQVFDAAVNHGIENAVRFLQRAAGVADDGIVGPVTVARVKSMDRRDLLDLFEAERLEFYTKLTTWTEFGRGWARRVATNLRFHAKDCA